MIVAFGLAVWLVPIRYAGEFVLGLLISAILVALAANILVALYEE